MISVDEAVGRIARAFAPVGSERVPIQSAACRVLSEDITARFDQPPAPMSAMDGYAVRAADAKLDAELSVVGVSPAGKPFVGQVHAGQAVRIFTGGVVPEGADAVVLQEDVQARENHIRVKEAPPLGDNVRARGLDFRAGDILLTRGHRISGEELGC